MEKTLFRVAALGVLVLGTPLQGIARADNLAEPVGLIAPKGLRPCAPSDPVAVAVARVAASMGSEFLSCFQSEKKVGIEGAAKLATVPLEEAFAIRVAGGGYTSGDIDRLQSTATAQWKNFQPLSAEFHDNYIARLNELMKGAGETSAVFSSVKPVLVSIDRLDTKSYSVVSIRSYVVKGGGRKVSATKVNADAVVLRGRDLIRLTMQRMLTDVSDVAQLRAEISDWARATEGAQQTDRATKP